MTEVDTASHPTPSPIGNARLARASRIALLVGMDALCLFAAASVAYVVWAQPVRSQPAGIYLQLLPFLGLFLLSYAQAGLYPGLGLGPVETLRKASYATTSGFILLATATFAIKLPHLYSRATFGIALLLSLALIPSARFALAHLGRRIRWWREPVVVVGTGSRAERAVEVVNAAPTLGYRAVAALSVSSARPRRAVAGIPVVGGLEEAERLAELGVQVAIFEVDNTTERSVVDRLQRHFRHVIILRDFDDLPMEGVEIRNFGGFMGVEYTNNLLKPHNRAVKRLMDATLGLAALLLALPLILLAVLAAKIASPGPAFFRQRRIGLNGSEFLVTRIRTMHPDADRLLEGYLGDGSPHREEWQLRKKIAADPRLIPRVGRFLRRWSIDELPQLWSVVTGRMALVGPRPLPGYHLDEFGPDFRDLRQRVRPGLTGMWQVMIRSDGGLAEQEAFDSYYIRNWSVWLDIYLLAKTVTAVLSGRGAY